MPHDSVLHILEALNGVDALPPVSADIGQGPLDVCDVVQRAVELAQACTHTIQLGLDRSLGETPRGDASGSALGLEPKIFSLSLSLPPPTPRPSLWLMSHDGQCHCTELVHLRFRLPPPVMPNGHEQAVHSQKGGGMKEWQQVEGTGKGKTGWHNQSQEHT